MSWDESDIPFDPYAKWGEGGKNTPPGYSEYVDPAFNPFAEFWFEKFEEDGREGFPVFTELFHNLDRASHSNNSIQEVLLHVPNGDLVLRSILVYERASGYKFPFNLGDKFTAQHLQFLKNSLTQLLLV